MRTSQELTASKNNFSEIHISRPRPKIPSLSYYYLLLGTQIPRLFDNNDDGLRGTLVVKVGTNVVSKINWPFKYHGWRPVTLIFHF